MVSAQVAILTASDASAYDYFGISVALDGDVMVVGANPGGYYLGSAYLYHTSDKWVTRTEVKLTASDAASLDYFGCSVAGSGGVVVGGTYGDDCDDGSDYCGAAYLYHTSDNWVNWTEVKLTAGDAASGDWFGSSAVSYTHLTLPTSV